MNTISVRSAKIYTDFRTHITYYVASKKKKQAVQVQRFRKNTWKTK